MNFLLPDEPAVRRLLGQLFGDDTVVTACPAADEAHDWAAIYIDRSDAPVAACLCSRELAAFASAALMMLPPAAAKDAAKGGSLSEAMTESLREIMNICSRLLMNDQTPHLRLADVAERGSATQLGALSTSGNRRDFQVEIPKYGKGRLSCVVT